jgi:hypothetical protein
MTTAAQVVKKYVNGHYGELVNATEPTFNDDTKVWESELASYYPRLIRDDADPSQSAIKFVYLPKLGRVELDAKLNLMFATPRSVCSALVGERFTLYRQRAERIMVEASATNIAGLTDAQHVLAPVMKVVDNLLDRETKLPEIRDEDFEDRDNVGRYWQLLVDAGIVIRVPGGYNSGEQFIDLFSKFRNNYELLIRAVLGHVIRQKYAALRSVFEMSELEPDIHVDNSYYWPALEADQSLHLKTDSLRERFMTTYDTMISVGRFKYYLQELRRVECLRQETSGWVANEDLFGEMRRIRGSALETPTLRV